MLSTTIDKINREILHFYVILEIKEVNNTMTLEELKALIKNVATNLDNQAEVTKTLADLEKEVETIYHANDSFKQKHEEYEKQITSLKETNMDLFLRQGNPVESEKLNTPEPLTYGDLIMDLGGLENGE